jgi:periplasmic divalent cation tolerance protein
MRLVLCNCPPDAADALARLLVERRLAACVNALPGVRSTYEWQGALCVTEETTLLIKTRDDLLDALTAALVEAHPYELPEVIALPITEGHQPYLEWIIAQTSGGLRPPPAGVTTPSTSPPPPPAGVSTPSTSPTA